jgi:drug/metabolite transporter (DMT)-like permease
MRGRTAGTELSLVVAAILLGLNFVAIKIAVVSIPPLLVGALRFTAGGLLLLAVLWLVERPAHARARAHLAGAGAYRGHRLQRRPQRGHPPDERL